ncbi:MAG: DUF4013 domain-containing protein [Anaerolineaceae bacterium]|nr:DUF4013 domain-containing protein [Anaerolineaceae bacterium]
MSTTFTTAPIKQVLTYPFKDERWQGKVIIGMLIGLANFIIPILPALIVSGYYYQIMHRILVDDGELHLPEWDDWGKLIKDGWRLFCVNFIYNLPGVIFIMMGAVIYFVGVFAFTLASTEYSVPEESIFLLFLFMGIMFVCLTIGMVLAVVGGIAAPPALCNTVKHDSFKAAFRFSEWWRVLKANFGGFFIALLIGFGVYMIIMFVAQIFYMTMLCSCLMLPISMIGGYYFALVFYAIIPLVYKEGLEKLKEQTV